MKRIITLFTIILSVNLLSGQTTVDFEDFGLPVDSFLNGNDLSGGFTTGNIFLPNDYNPMWNSYNGWAISTTRDTLTPGSDNQFSSITGGGYNGSQTYAVTYAFNPTKIILNGDAAGKVVAGVYITNNTYAYTSMRDGDGFTKKFGGLDGTDEDFFLLTIKKYRDGVLSTDSIDFYLADYRFADSTQDYLVDEWTYVDLTSLGDVDSLEFKLSSSDSGMFGMNNPAYFCIDNLQTLEWSASLENPFARRRLSIFPNPANNQVNVEWPESRNGEAILFDATGREVMRNTLSFGRNQFDISRLPIGIYTVSVRGEANWYQSRLVKN